MESAPKTKFSTIDEYHAAFPENIQKLLQEIRETIHKAAPEAEEVISYNMPGFKLNSMLVWYAGYKNHIGFYPKGASAIHKFKDELARYKTSKGAIQFPIEGGIPKKLVQEIVKFRVNENLAEAEIKKQKK